MCENCKVKIIEEEKKQISPRTIELYEDARDIEESIVLNTDTKRYETIIIYLSDSVGFKNKCIYVVDGIYEIESINKNIVTLKTKE